jgi:hypothetical protein
MKHYDKIMLEVREELAKDEFNILNVIHYKRRHKAVFEAIKEKYEGKDGNEKHISANQLGNE